MGIETIKEIETLKEELQAKAWNAAIDTMAEMLRTSHKTVDEIQKELKK